MSRINEFSFYSSLGSSGHKCVRLFSVALLRRWPIWTVCPWRPKHELASRSNRDIFSAPARGPSPLPEYKCGPIPGADAIFFVFLFFPRRYLLAPVPSAGPLRPRCAASSIIVSAVTAAGIWIRFGSSVRLRAQHLAWSVRGGASDGNSLQFRERQKFGQRVILDAFTGPAFFKLIYVFFGFFLSAFFAEPRAF